MSSLNAPPVVYPVGRSFFLAVLLGSGWWMAAGVTLMWRWAAASNDRLPWLGVCALAVSTLGLWLGWRRMPQGRLAWDGHGWTWQSSGYRSSTTVARPEVVLDLQRLVLIRMHNQAGAPWLVWADARSEPGLWLDLRRALHARPHNAGASAQEAQHHAQP